MTYVSYTESRFFNLKDKRANKKSLLKTSYFKSDFLIWVSCV